MSRGPDRSSASTSSTRADWWPLAALAVIVYVPLLLTRPGWVSADTKSYLYLDPSRLLSRAWSMWDPSLGLGTVTHQNIGYLWPMGPWFWLCEQLGLPDWVAQRIWWGTLLWGAGAGMVYLLRRLRWPVAAIWPAVFVYALSPYLLTHIGRLSAVLLPWVGLPWLLGFTIEAVRRGGWRHPALIAITVATVGSVNLTALVLVALGPLLWLVHALVSRRVRIRRVLGAAARTVAITVPLSAWWLAGLSVQASHGTDIVRYSETAEVVASTSAAQEVLRGLGYWFFYGGDRVGPWTEAGVPYTQEPWLLVASFLIPTIALGAAAFTRWRGRGYPVVLVVVGALVAVGAHPWDDPSPLGRLVQHLLATQRGLAMRSLPRAVPLVALGLALLAGAAAGALARRRARVGLLAGLSMCVVAVLALPALWQGDLVSSSLRRQEVPEHWRAAIAAADRGDDGTRVLELPGSDFAYYRWGTTVDPVTPGLMDRPFVARELIPYPSAPGADLLNALDRRTHERTLDPDAIAPVARLLRAGDLLLRSDLQYERFNLARPRLMWQLLGEAPGLGAPSPFGTPVENEPVAHVQMQDEIWFIAERGLADPPPVALVPVEGVLPILSTKSSAATVVVDGSGDGIVDAASAGLLSGDELVRYAATLDGHELEDVLGRAALVVVTDTARERALRWRTVRDAEGFTEPAGFEPLVVDDTDQRLPVFPDASDATRTFTQHLGGLTASATSYGDANFYEPESRPNAAIDGDLQTAWRLGLRQDVRGERLVVTLDEPRAIDSVRLFQPRDRPERFLTRVRVTLDGGPSVLVDLDGSSRSADGQLVSFPRSTSDRVEIEIVADSAGDRPRYDSVADVGLAEVRINDDPALAVHEVVSLPRDVLDLSDRISGPLAILLTRLRHDPTEPWRDDDERALARSFRLGDDRALTLDGTARLSGRAPDAVLDELLGQAPPSAAIGGSGRLAGSLVERPAAAFDGDPSTAWTSMRGDVVGSMLGATFRTPVTLDHLDVEVVADGAHSVPTELEILVDGRLVATRPLPSVADGGLGTTAPLPVDIPSTTGTSLEVRISKVRPVTTQDRVADREIPQPVGIAELRLPGVRVPPATDVDTGCRSDLLRLDGEPVRIRVTGSAEDATSARPLTVQACDGPLPLRAGEHQLSAVPGRVSGIDLDQLLLLDGSATPAGEPGPQPEIRRSDPDSMEAVLPRGVERHDSWLVLGESFNDGWRASVDGRDLGPPTLVDGFANGWRLPDGADAATVSLRFQPQRRVDLALVISAVAAAVAVALAIRRPRGEVLVWPDDPLELVAPLALPRPPSSWGRAVATGVVSGLLALLVLPPPVALVVAVVATTGLLVRWVRGAVRVAPLALMGLSGAYVAVAQHRHDYGQGGLWVLDVERAHLVVVAAVVLLVVDLVLDVPTRDAARDLS